MCIRDSRHPAGVAGLLQGAAQALRRVDRRADSERHPAVAVEAGRQRVPYGLQEHVGEDLRAVVLGRDRGQGDERDRLIAGVGDGDPVGGFRARRQRVGQDLLQQRLGDRAALQVAAVPLDAGDDDLPVRGRAQSGQEDGGGHPQTGGDLRRGGSRLDQLKDLLGQPAADRAGRVPAVALHRDQLGDALEQVEPLLRPVPGVRLDGQQPVRQHRLPHVTGGVRGAGAAADWEEGEDSRAQRHPMRAPPARADGREMLGREPGAHVGGQGGAGGLRTGDQPARGGQDPGAQVQVRTEQVQDHVRAAARRARGHHPPVPVDHGRQVAGPLAAHLSHDVLGDRRERHRLVHREEREVVAGARHHEVVGDVPEFRLAGRQRGHPGLHEDPYEGLGVGGVPAPGQPGQDHFPAREIAAGVPEVGGHHAAHGAIQLGLAAEQPEAQRVRVQQCAQPHVSSPPFLVSKSTMDREGSSCSGRVPGHSGCAARFQRKTRRLPMTSVHTNLQDARPGQPTPSWFP